MKEEFWQVQLLLPSCRAEVLWRVASVMLRKLRLDRPPRITADVADQAREAWTKVATSSQGQDLSFSAKAQSQNVQSEKSTSRHVWSAFCLTLKNCLVFSGFGEA
uniref:Uncharacterized protein n=1 Tax=Sphaerodactylus townsendi TaxID=933632 RepID=A0ACB8G8I4_9SAUR